jgi:formate hydrogenlyase subunit 3/multisubunit Na+/H+ antiporter MnhD subunit
MALLFASAIARLALPGRLARPAWLWLLLAGNGAAIASALPVLAGHPVPPAGFATALPGGTWLFQIDPLSAWFVVLILTVGSLAAVFGAGYLPVVPRPAAVALADATMAVLLAAMALLVAAQAAVPLLIAWELMAIAGLLLILHDGARPEVRRSALVYLVATHAASLALLALFALWGRGAADLTFPHLRAAIVADPRAKGLLLGLGLLGFGIKAGVVPLHSWLPGAHASAPSHVSAVMSGVMIKTGIYGLIRLTLLLDPAPAAWGWTLLALGMVSGVLGVLWALAQHDLKRLLAYHSVENIGIILIGLGAGALGLSYGLPVLATLGIAGALLHTANHALFKSLLFLGSGAIGRGSGTRDIDALGGLARRMPWTWGAFLIASIAIVGLPPLNGFVSEWTIALALLAGLDAPGAVRTLTAGLVGLGLIGGLALACFTKVDGAMFLGEPRTRAARDAREVGALMRGPMVALAAACVALGLFPALALDPALRVATALTSSSSAALAPALAALAAGATRVSWLALLFVAMLLAAALLRNGLLRRRILVEETWACGYPVTTPRMQYTAASFAAPLLATFGRLAGLRVERTARSFATRPVDLILDRAARPLWRRLNDGAARLRWMQSGRLHEYLLYVLATLAILLVYLGARGIR